MPQPPRPGEPDPPVEPSGTLIESEEEVRQAIVSGLKERWQAVPAAHPLSPRPERSPAPRTSPVHAAPSEQAIHPYRPTTRPPIAILTVCDDGKNEGEVIRIRDTKFVIGRTEGDLRIPIDGRISARHVEITLQAVGGAHRWVVTDLQSTHGMFVRVSRTVLNDQAEILIGGGRYRFEAPQGQPSANLNEGSEAAGFDHTRGWTDGPSPFRPPVLSELIGDETGNRLLLVKPEYWIGSDPSCQIDRANDPFCEPRHVRLFRDPHGNWHAEHNKTLNGLWIRMSQIVVEAAVRFQIGEQRFQIKA